MRARRTTRVQQHGDALVAEFWHPERDPRDALDQPVETCLEHDVITGRRPARPRTPHVADVRFEHGDRRQLVPQSTSVVSSHGRTARPVRRFRPPAAEAVEQRQTSPTGAHSSSHNRPSPGTAHQANGRRVNGRDSRRWHLAAGLVLFLADVNHVCLRLPIPRSSQGQTGPDRARQPRQ